MKRNIIKWSFRLVGTALFLAGLLLILILNPGLLYANKTTQGSYTIYHNRSLDSGFGTALNRATALIKGSELYSPQLKLDVCLDDGSRYPALIQLLQGPAFGYGFYNKVVIMGSINTGADYTSYRGYKWNLTQLLAHEAIHCFQFNRFGLFGANPIAKYADWKWDGYNEYIARQAADQKDLANNISRLRDAELKEGDAWGIAFADSTFVGRDYYRWWLLMQYCKDIKRQTYRQILQDSTGEDSVKAEMMSWYSRSQH